MADSRQIKGTVLGFNLWAFEKFCEINGFRDCDGVRAVLQKWVDLDADALARIGITRDAYEKAVGGNVRKITGLGNGSGA